METVAAIAYRGQDRASLREMVRRTVFNLLVGNGDAHLKNWSLIYPDRKRARLSPAYDLVCTAVYLPAPGDLELGLPFFGVARLSEVSREHFARLKDLLRVGDGEGKYHSNVETVVGLAHRGRDRDSLREAVRRTAFNLLVGNGDAHLKNWSLIYPDRRRARLSPAYDLVCTAVYLPAPGDPELGLPLIEIGRASCRERV